MKKILKIMVLMIVLIPVIIYGKTYSEAANKAKNYMETSYKDTYTRYLYDGKTMSSKLPFGSDGQTGSETNAFYSSLTGTILGGLLNKSDYEASRPCDTCRSYLYDGQPYWTLTAVSGGHYVVGREVGLADDNTTPAVRVVEFVKHDTVVTGRGTKLDPWKFKPKYKITVKAINGRIGLTRTSLGDKAESVIDREPTVTFFLDFDAGNSYLYDTCGLTPETSTPREITDAKKITFNTNINTDITCEIVFGKGLFKLTIPEENGLIKQADPKEFYAKSGERFYLDDEGKQMILGLSQRPEKRGYDFKGYEYEISATNKVLVIGSDGLFINSSTSKIAENKELQTKWDAKSIVITLNANGGSGGSNTATVTFGQPYGSDNWTKPTRTGHTLIGWFTLASGGTQRKNDDIVDITETETLYAHWSVNNYTITYDANGGTGAPSATTYTYATSGSTNLSSTQPTRSGHSFLGWSTSSSATSATYSAGQAWDLNNANNYTLYAVWKACGKGYYLNGNTCSKCSANTYSTGSANSSCTNCPSGYSSSAGSDEKKDCTISCNANYRVNTADAKCTTACASGYKHDAHTVSAGSTSSACTAIGTTACKTGQTRVRRYSGDQGNSTGFVYKNKDVGNGKKCTTYMTVGTCSSGYCAVSISHQCGGDSNGNYQTDVSFSGYMYQCCITNKCDSCSCAG